MNNQSMYDLFSLVYDRFVNWDERLSAEIPFLTSELSALCMNEDKLISVLDAACGTGQHAIALAERGFDCAGSDISAGMVEIARNNATQSNQEILFKQAGFGQLVGAFGVNRFDGLICLGNSLPHILDEQELKNTLSDFRSVLRSGGKLIIQNRNFDQVLSARSRWMAPQTYRENDKTWLFARFYDFDADSRLTFNILTLFSQGSDDFTQQVMSTRLWALGKDELTDFLGNVGFEDFYYYGDLEGSVYDEKTSPNLIITARIK